MIFKKNKDTKKIEDILLNTKTDRRLMPNVPDDELFRARLDRRGNYQTSQDNGYKRNIKSNREGQRYQTLSKVSVQFREKKTRHKIDAEYIDISGTGMLIRMKNDTFTQTISEKDSCFLKYRVEPGTMPEGFEMKFSMRAEVIRIIDDSENDIILIGVRFAQPMAQYIKNKKDRYIFAAFGLMLFFVTLFIILMRAESVIYFKFNKGLYFYSLVAAVFLLSRYLFGALYRPMDINPDFTPGVTIIIPCFNEEEWIDQTIKSCMNQDYPMDKLEVIVVDDCSTDRSVEKIKETIDLFYNEAERYKTKERLSYIVMEQNAGKRDALAKGTLVAQHDLIVFVDSDSFLDPFAIRNLVQPFQDPKMGGVSGRTDVANTYTNTLTKMQSVRYYIAFRIMKAAEAYFDAVTCLSGPLACYRKDIIMDNMDEWLNQKFLGQRATFGDDRALTNLVLRNYRTNYQDTAICSTIVPNDYGFFLKQQMRWKRSWLRESIIAGGFIWKKEPFTSIFFYMGLIVPIAAPIIVLYNLIYVPIMHRVFPTTFIVGLFMMALMMSFTQMLFRKSSTWKFGLVFVLFYEAVLLWQMPIAWVTFWKSTWGTRMTPEDLKEQERKVLRKNKKKSHITSEQENNNEK